MSKIKKFLGLVFLVFVVLLAAGAVGAWFYNRYYQPTVVERTLPDDKLNLLADSAAQIIIQDPKKIVVEQDKQVAELTAAAEKTFVALFNKNTAGDYNLTAPLATGLILTNDGWLVTNLNKVEAAKGGANLVAVTKDRKIYEVEKIVFDETAELSFVRLRKANSLSVVNLGRALDLRRGQTVIGLGWYKPVALGIVTDLPQAAGLLSSERPLREIKVSFTADELALLDLSGRVVGWFKPGGKVVGVDYLINASTYLLSNKPLVKTYLGVNYLDLNVNLTAKESAGILLAKDKKTPAVIKGSPADKAGLKEGDVIKAIDELEVGRGLDLADVINKYQSGQKVLIKYRRGTDDKEVTVELGGIK